jgi:hypothetical protein
MKIDVRDRFLLELLLSMAVSNVRFTEHNDLTTASRRLVSYEFPREIAEPSLDDICMLASGFREDNYKSAELFLKSFARKDPKRFATLAADQAKPRHYRQYDAGKLSGAIVSIATIYGIDYTETPLKF